MDIIYKKWIRNWYAKLKGEDILLVIPYSAKWDRDFYEKMLKIWEKLRIKIDKKEKKQIISNEWILLFWERIPNESILQIRTEKQLNNFLKNELYDYVNPLLQIYANKLWFHNIPVTIRKVKTKWGSCTHDNRIMFNLNLVHLSTKLIQYVIIHEACHLREKNHGEKFWSLVEKYCPDYKSSRKELKNQLLI